MAVCLIFTSLISITIILRMVTTADTAMELVTPATTMVVISEILERFLES